jgi:RNA polymerase sigma-70 factor (ECF subfamily)
MTSAAVSLASPVTADRSRANDTGADFETVFRREERRLFGIAFSILRDPLEAEEALQETSLQAWRSWSGLAQPDRASAWLTTICVRHCVAHRRWLGVMRWRNIPDHPQLIAATDHLHYDGRYVDLDRAYRSLSPRQRAVITLHYQHGHSVPACAALMGCSTGAAASHLSRALAKLRKELADD